MGPTYSLIRLTAIFEFFKKFPGWSMDFDNCQTQTLILTALKLTLL